MTTHARREQFEKTVALLKPAFERVVSDPAYRKRLEADPLAALDEVGVTLDAQTREELSGKTFSEFWAGRRSTVEGPVQVRELPPEDDGALDEEQLSAIAGGAFSAVLGKGPVPSFAPPYVPVGPVVMSDGMDDQRLPNRLLKK
jgi:hypothetical protein